MLFYLKYHTLFPRLKEEYQIGKNTWMCSGQKGGFTLSFDCSFETAHPLLGCCATQPLWTHQIKFQAFFHWRGTIRLFYLSSVLQSATASSFPVFLGRCPSCTSFACPTERSWTCEINCLQRLAQLYDALLVPSRETGFLLFYNIFFPHWDTRQTDNFVVEACRLGVNVC